MFVINEQRHAKALKVIFRQNTKPSITLQYVLIVIFFPSKDGFYS
jgi:hypothetical protein